MELLTNIEINGVYAAILFAFILVASCGWDLRKENAE
jgi:outer membrane lipopolysaccharide assembly protein LptE/RlpB